MRWVCEAQMRNSVHHTCASRAQRSALESPAEASILPRADGLLIERARVGLQNEGSIRAIHNQA